MERLKAWFRSFHPFKHPRNSEIPHNPRIRNNSPIIPDEIIPDIPHPISRRIIIPISRRSITDSFRRREPIDITDTVECQEQDIVDKSVYSIDSNEKLINWKDRDDIIIHIPAGAVPPGTQSTIAITPVQVKDCMIPEDLYLVSDVFEVASQCKFLKPVTLKLRHCVMLNEKSDDATIHQLTFVKAESTSEKFEKIEGGEFAVEGSNSLEYGILSRYSYCILGVCIERILDIFLYRLRCNMKILRNRSLSNPSYRRHYISVIVTKDLNNISEQALKNFKSSYDLLKTNAILQLWDHEVKITNKQCSEGNYEVHRCWDVTPTESPSKISKNFIFEYDGSTTPPNLNFLFENKCICRSPQSCASLKHSFKFEGLYDGSVIHTFTVDPQPAVSDHPHRKDQPKLTEDLVLEVLVNIPVTTQLQTFCTNLGLPSARCSEIFDDPTIRGDFSAQRHRVLRLWGDVEERTWENFIKALDRTGYHQKARELAKKYKIRTPSLNAMSTIDTPSIPQLRDYCGLEDITAEQPMIPTLSMMTEHIPVTSTSAAALLEVEEVYSLLKNKAHEWEDIGRELKVPDYLLDEIRDEDFSPKSKLEKVLIEWEESQCSDVSWDNIKKVLKRLHYNNLTEDRSRKEISLACRDL